METWQYIVTLCAGIITLITFFDKIGVTKSVKKVDADFKELKGLIEQVSKTGAEVAAITALQEKQAQALLAILRNDLYRCFKDHRDIAAWTDDDCRVQTNIHEAYKALGGNGEEAIWWEKKKTWKIISEDELEDLKLRKLAKFHD
jgi:hypothetical protein